MDSFDRVNSKAMIRVPFDALLPLVPRVLHPQILSSRYTTQRTQSLVIQSDESRKRAANVESCFEKLYQLLKASAEDTIPGETSPEQKNRVQKLYASLCCSFLLALANTVQTKSGQRSSDQVEKTT